MTVDWPEDLVPPPFADGDRPGLLDVLAPLRDTGTEPHGRELIILLDGLGHDLLMENLALTPNLRALREQIEPVQTIFPSTTAVAMTSLHTGEAPLRHGVVGYRTFDPVSGDAVHQLRGQDGIDPATWMPLPGLAESTDRRCIQVAPARHQGSLLSGGSFRRWSFAGHGRSDRVGVALRALYRAGENGIVHLHVDDIDHSGHLYGTGSQAWRDALSDADAVVGALLRRAPTETRIRVTADHGMVDTAPELLVDLSRHDRIARSVRAVSGEARALMLHVQDGADPGAVAASVQDAVGERALALTREQALEAGLWGAPGERPALRVHGRLGDVVVLARGRHTVELTHLRPVGDSALTGVHGSLTAREAIVPLLVTEV